MASLPVVGQDSGTWGTILNNFLQVSLNADGTMSPAAVASAFAKISIQTSGYSPGASQGEIILVNATSGGITITMPSAVSNDYLYSIKKTDSSSNSVTIATTSSQTIDGGTTAVILVQYAAVTLVSDGSNWNVI